VKPRNRIRFGLAALVAWSAVAGGCGLFDTAKPELPGSGNPLPPPDFTLPDSTLATLEHAIEGQSPSNFGLCFADTLIDERGFHATFDPSDIQEYLLTHTSAPNDWTRSQELSFFNQFLGTLSSTPVVQFLPDPRPDRQLGTTGVIWNRRYRIYVGPTAVAAGSAGLHIERVNLAGDWKITFWEDRRDTTNVPTWGTRRLNGR
jgi:hypothetical protein